MSDQNTPNRCRIVLITPPDGPGIDERVASALGGGDVASLIVPNYGRDEATFQDFAGRMTGIAHEHNVACVVAGEPRIAARVHADGVHIEGSLEDLEEAIEKHQAKMMIGCGDIRTRDDAMVFGEAEPDYLFFGKFGFDTKPEPHPRNLALGEWWSEVMQLPCIVLAGSDIASVIAVAKTGADFVAIGNAVFGEGVEPAKVVAEANALLDASAPRFEE